MEFHLKGKTNESHSYKETKETELRGPDLHISVQAVVDGGIKPGVTTNNGKSTQPYNQVLFRK